PLFLSDLPCRLPPCCKVTIATLRCNGSSIRWKGFIDWAAADGRTAPAILLLSKIANHHHLLRRHHPTLLGMDDSATAPTLLHDPAKGRTSADRLRVRRVRCDRWRCLCLWSSPCRWVDPILSLPFLLLLGFAFVVLELPLVVVVERAAAHRIAHSDERI